MMSCDAWSNANVHSALLPRLYKDSSSCRRRRSPKLKPLELELDQFVEKENLERAWNPRKLGVTPSNFYPVLGSEAKEHCSIACRRCWQAKEREGSADVLQHEDMELSWSRLQLWAWSSGLGAAAELLKKLNSQVKQEELARSEHISCCIW